MYDIDSFVFQEFIFALRFKCFCVIMLITVEKKGSESNTILKLSI